MVLSTEWSQVEVIDLVNDGSGLGFGIVGGRSTGVVIKSILPGGLADKDSRLQSGDHILQIGEVNLRGLAADQVASVLRQAGAQVRMVVARPVEPASSDFQNFGGAAPIVPTKILTDSDELDRLLQQNGYGPYHHDEIILACDDDPPATSASPNLIIEDDTGSVPAENNNIDSDITKNNPLNDNNDVDVESTLSDDVLDFVITPADIELGLPETERLIVELTKDDRQGLGITIAGYVCEREDLSGIFVKGLSEGSEAHRCGRIDINDRIVEVDGQSLQGFTNFQAVDKLRRTEAVVRLTLERYLRGPKYEQLQEALAVQQEQQDLSPASPSQTTLSWIPIDNDEALDLEGISLASEPSATHNLESSKEIFIEEDFKSNPDDDLESATKKKWEEIIGDHREIIVANLTKLKGLGISLEGTVDVEGGVELRPHHYIRSILPEGPVGQSGRLTSGDELLEVNGQKLLGIRHVDVVKLLRELPNAVRLVCARTSEENRVINTSQDREGFEARNILGGSLKNLLPQPEQRLLKALSDTSINTSSTVTVTSEPSLQKAKSRSLEVTNLAMWSESIEFVELVKSDRGLGFSILDYQDPIDPKCTVIVVRSLVPNGAAEQDGRITPGDRLISVNGRVIKNATLDEAVQALKGTMGVVKLGVAKPLPNSRASEAVSSTLGS